jgi:urea transport system substrate-binding protein
LFDDLGLTTLWYSESIEIEILHSLTGITSISEKPMVDGALWAWEELNQRGGVFGRLVEPRLMDCASEPGVFAERAEELLRDPRVSGLFGCWSSASRKAVKAVVERHGSVLWYPLCFEGLKQSANILYTNTCLNQQIEPGVRWALRHGAQRCQVMGSDDVYPPRRELIQATMRYLPYAIEPMDVALPPQLADRLLHLARTYDDDAIKETLLLGSDANE